MIQSKDFKKTVRAMSAKDIILAMVEGLKNPVTKIDMSTYGQVYDGVCYGCAATNTICNIQKIDKKKFLELDPDRTMSESFKTENFVANFEEAINELRQGDFEWYNEYAKLGKFAMIPLKYFECELPHLGDDYTPEDLLEYVSFANQLEE